MTLGDKLLQEKGEKTPETVEQLQNNTYDRKKNKKPEALISNSEITIFKENVGKNT